MSARSRAEPWFKRSFDERMAEEREKRGEAIVKRGGWHMLMHGSRVLCAWLPDLF